MKKSKQIHDPYFFILNGKKHLNFGRGVGPRYWTTHESVSHYLHLNRTPESPEVIGCNVEWCSTKEEAKKKSHEALENKKYGMAFVYINEYKHSFCYAVHFPRFKSEGNGFINFHCVDNITPAEKIPVRIDYDNPVTN